MLGDAWRYFLIVQIGEEVVTGISWVEVSNVVEPPAVHRSAPMTKNNSIHNVSNAKTGKPSSERHSLLPIPYIVTPCLAKTY
jgi:hypothetical protein